MQVYLVNAGDKYYPSWDNTVFVTTDKEKAYRGASKLEAKGNYDWVGVAVKGVQDG